MTTLAYVVARAYENGPAFIMRSEEYKPGPNWTLLYRANSFTEAQTLRDATNNIRDSYEWFLKHFERKACAMVDCVKHAYMNGECVLCGALYCNHE